MSLFVRLYRFVLCLLYLKFSRNDQFEFLQMKFSFDNFQKAAGPQVCDVCFRLQHRRRMEWVCRENVSPCQVTSKLSFFLLMLSLSVFVTEGSPQPPTRNGELPQGLLPTMTPTEAQGMSRRDREGERLLGSLLNYAREVPIFVSVPRAFSLPSGWRAVVTLAFGKSSTLCLTGLLLLAHFVEHRRDRPTSAPRENLSAKVLRGVVRCCLRSRDVGEAASLAGGHRKRFGGPRRVAGNVYGQSALVIEAKQM